MARVHPGPPPPLQTQQQQQEPASGRETHGLQRSNTGFEEDAAMAEHGNLEATYGAEARALARKQRALKNAETGEVEKKDTPRQAGKDIMAEKTAQGHGKPAQKGLAR